MGFAVLLGSNLISWKSKKQHTISRSSTEVEYCTAAYTTGEIQWLCQLLFDLAIFVQIPIRLLCDNIYATYVAINPVLHGRSKHIKVGYHFVREMAARAHLRVKYVPMQSQLLIFSLRAFVSEISSIQDQSIRYTPVQIEGV